MKVTRFEVRDDLRGVNIRELPHRFDLNDERLTDHEVGAPFANHMSLVAHLKRNLSIERHLSQSKLDGQSLFVHCLGKSGTQISMHLNRGADNPMGQIIDCSGYLGEAPWSLGVLEVKN